MLSPTGQRMRDQIDSKGPLCKMRGWPLTLALFSPCSAKDADDKTLRLCYSDIKTFHGGHMSCVSTGSKTKPI